MSLKDNGGPAFPLDRYDERGKLSKGISKRDWFAGQALKGFTQMYILESSSARTEELEKLRDEVATCCYRLADAMLKARKEVA